MHRGRYVHLHIAAHPCHKLPPADADVARCRRRQTAGAGMCDGDRSPPGAEPRAGALIWVNALSAAVRHYRDPEAGGLMARLLLGLLPKLGGSSEPPFSSALSAVMPRPRVAPNLIPASSADRGIGLVAASVRNRLRVSARRGEAAMRRIGWLEPRPAGVTASQIPQYIATP